MAAFSYTARTRTGDKTNGTIDAADRTMAVAQIERMGYVPITVRESTGKDSGTRGKGRKSKGSDSKARGGRRISKTKGENVTKTKKMKMRDVLLFSTEVRDLIRSGMTLGSALDALATRGENPNRDAIISGLRDDIIQGTSFSDALEKHPDSFPQFYSSMVRAGEASGQLPEAFDNIVEHYERMQEAKESVTAALVYPVFVLVVGIGTIIFCLIFVIPKFKQVFAGLGQDLPALTRLLMNSSEGLLNYWWLIFPVILLICMAIGKYIKTPIGQRKFHSLQLRMPIVKNIVANNAFSQFSRTLGGLLRNGVPVLSALKITKNITSNVIIAEEISRVQERVQDGAAMSKTLKEGGVFPPLFTDMLSVGEQTGDVPGALINITHRYEGDLKRSLKNFTTILEPLFLLFIAGAVGFVALALLLAVFKLTSGLG